MFERLDPLLHAPLRLGVISILTQQEEAHFIELQKKTSSTAGNLSIQIKKLEKEGYLKVVKQFQNNYPQTICKITNEGREAFESYLIAMDSYINRKK